ncbi:hypothetical protein [Saccharothrix sp.]|uniref:hypothetical protein n=1 Tax=Saccharothrix sp. TaxID=1873460 RepID=UPI0028118FBF|nr:hypothetical protein [Saccharothrix sp.]
MASTDGETPRFHPAAHFPQAAATAQYFRHPCEEPRETAPRHGRPTGTRTAATALRRAIAHTDTEIKRTIRNLELVDNPDRDLIRDVNQRRAELHTEKEHPESRLAEAEQQAINAPRSRPGQDSPQRRRHLPRTPTAAS